MRERIAVVGSGYMAGVIAKRAQEMKIESYCFGLDDNPYMLEFADNFVEMDIFDINAICHFCKENNINGVIATTELTILPVACIAEMMGLNGNPVFMAKNITNKAWVRERLAYSKIVKHPRVYKNEQDICQKDFPFIVKPTSAGGKRGIKVWS